MSDVVDDMQVIEGDFENPDAWLRNLGECDPELADAIKLLASAGRGHTPEECIRSAILSRAQCIKEKKVVMAESEMNRRMAHYAAYILSLDHGTVVVPVEAEDQSGVYRYIDSGQPVQTTPPSSSTH